jgi:hypothetical protein
MAQPSRRASRGRAVLLRGVVLFAAIQLAAGLLLDYGCPQVRFPFFYAQLARLDYFSRPPNVLILGSSRTGHVMSDSLVTEAMRDLTGDQEVECFNAFCLGGDAVVSASMLDKILEHGIQPRIALIEITPEEICRRNGWLFNYHHSLLRWDDVPGWITELVRSRDMKKFAESRVFPTYYYRDQIRKYVARCCDDWYAGRAAPAPGSRYTAGPAQHLTPGDAAKWQSLIAEGLRNSVGTATHTSKGDMNMLDRWFRDYQVGGHAAAALDRQLAVCRAHGIEPILYSPPLSSIHRGFYRPEIEAAFQATVAAMSRKYHCRYFDYRTLLPDACFIDHHHCSSDCLAPFSRKIALEVLAPAWCAAAPSGETGHD